jgi:RNA polymerase sigma factor (sigma-70 family)
MLAATIPGEQAGASSMRRSGPPRVAAVHDSGTTDRHVLAGLLAGDQRALEEAYRAHGGLVFGLARRVTGRDDLAREITQDVFTHLWEHPDQVDPSRGTLRAFLGVVTHRRSVDAIRRTGRRARAESRAADQSDVVQRAHDAEIAEAGLASWRATKLRALLAELPPEQRRAVELAYYEGHTYREVATALGIPEGTAKSRLRLALAHLRDLLGPDLGAWT